MKQALGNPTNILEILMFKIILVMKASDLNLVYCISGFKGYFIQILVIIVSVWVISMNNKIKKSRYFNF